MNNEGGQLPKLSWVVKNAISACNTFEYFGKEKYIYMTLAKEDKCATENLGKEYNFKFP